MTLEEVVDATLMGADADETLDQLRDRIANAVRAFLGSEEVVDAMASEMWNDEFMRATGRVVAFAFAMFAGTIVGALMLIGVI